jgi:hypothetical protein
MTFFKPITAASAVDVRVRDGPWEDIQSFVDGLAALPFSTWLSIGAEVLDHTDVRVQRTTALEILDASLAD